MSRVLAALEKMPTGDEIRAERERTGEGMMTIANRHRKAAVLQAIAEAKSLDDMKIILARVVEKTWHA